VIRCDELSIIYHKIHLSLDIHLVKIIDQIFTEC